MRKWPLNGCSRGSGRYDECKGTVNLNFLLNRTEEETEKGTVLSVSRDRTRETNVAGVHLGRERVHTTSYPSHLAYSYFAYKGSTAVHSQPAAAQAQENKIRSKACTIEAVQSADDDWIV